MLPTAWLCRCQWWHATRLVYRPRRDGRLSRPCCEVSPAEIRTRNLWLQVRHSTTQPPARLEDVQAKLFSCCSERSRDQLQLASRPLTEYVAFSVVLVVNCLWNVTVSCSVTTSICCVGCLLVGCCIVSTRQEFTLNKWKQQLINCITWRRAAASCVDTVGYCRLLATL